MPWCCRGALRSQDDFFLAASEYARKLGLPRIYISSNSGARIGLVEELKPKFKVGDRYVSFALCLDFFIHIFALEIFVGCSTEAARSAGGGGAVCFEAGRLRRLNALLLPERRLQLVSVYFLACQFLPCAPLLFIPLCPIFDIFIFLDAICRTHKEDPHQPSPLLPFDLHRPVCLVRWRGTTSPTPPRASSTSTSQRRTTPRSRTAPSTPRRWWRATRSATPSRTSSGRWGPACWGGGGLGRGVGRVSVVAGGALVCFVFFFVCSLVPRWPFCGGMVW